MQSSMDLPSEESESEFEQQQRNDDRWKLFRPFPRQTSTLVAGPSFLGKSTYVRKIVEHQHLFFQDPVVRLWVVNCNQSVTFSPLEEPKDDSELRRPLAQLEQRTWEDFDIEELNEGDVLLIDDLQQVTPNIREIINAATHHLALGHCFVVTHSILGSRQYELLNLVHRIALFCSSASVANLASYILSTRILDPELKSRLREALGAAQRSREVLVLELSALPDSLQPHHVACSHLLRLVDRTSGFAVVYPHPSKAEMYDGEADDVVDVEMVNPSAASRNLPAAGEFVGGSFLILRPELVAAVKRKKKKGKTKSSKTTGGGGTYAADGSGDEAGDDEACIDKDEQVWNRTVLQMESDVENFLPSKQWRCCKSLLYEILHNPAICLVKGGRRVKLHDRPGVVASLIDYLSAATRRDAPTERKTKAQTPEFKAFRHITAALLAHHAPKTLFKNRLVLPGKSELRRSPSSDSAEELEEELRAPEKRKVRKRREKSKKRTEKKLRRRTTGRERSRGVETSRRRDDDDDERRSPQNSPAEIEFGDLDFSTLH